MGINIAGTIIFGVLLFTSLFITIYSYRRHRDFTIIFTVCIVALAAMLLFSQYLTGSSNFLYASSDGYSTELPHLKYYAENLKKIIDSDGLVAWSFSVGFGGKISFAGAIFPTTLIPIIFMMLFGEEAMMISFAWMEVIKIILAATFMYMFLRKIRFTPTSCFTGALLYSLCGAIVLRGFWPFLADEFWIAALLLYSVECYYVDNKWIGIVISFVLLIWRIDIYHVYLYSVLLILYTIVRCIAARKKIWKSVLYLLKSGLFVILGISLYAFSFLQSSTGLFKSARFSEMGSDYSAELIASPSIISDAVSSLFSPSLIGAYSNYSGSLNLLERPLFFCGILAILVIPQAFYFGSKKSKRLMLTGMIFSAAYLLFPIVTDVFNAFITNKELEQRSYRLSSLWIIIIIAVSAAYAIQCIVRNGKANNRILLISLALDLVVLFVVVLLADRIGYSISYSSVAVAIGLLLIWTLVLLTLKVDAKQKLKKASSVIFAFCIVMDMGLGNASTVIHSAADSNYYYESMTSLPMGFSSENHVDDALEYIKSIDDGFFRISGINQGVYVATCQSPLYYGYFDSNYYTNIDGYTFEFLNSVYTEAFSTFPTGTKYSVGVGNDLELSTLTGYKYKIVVHDSDEGKTSLEGYSLIYSVGNLDIYKLDTSLSVGVAYQKVIRRSSFEKLSEEEKQRVLLKCIVIDDDLTTDLTEVSDKELEEICSQTDDHSAYENLVEERCSSGILSVSSWSNERISGTIMVSEDSELMLSIPYSNDWKVMVDGNNVGTDVVDIGFIGVSLTGGTHTVEIIYDPDNVAVGYYISGAAVVIFIFLIVITRKKKSTGYLAVTVEK